MKKLIGLLLFLWLLVPSVSAVAGSSCLSDPVTRKNYYNARRQADNLTNSNNRSRVNSSSNWVRRQEEQNYKLHKYKSQHSNFTESHWDD